MLLFCVGVDSSVDATLLGYTQRGAVCRRRRPARAVRDADARTYTHWHRGRFHVLRLRQTLTTERPEILLGDSAGQDITGQV